MPTVKKTPKTSKPAAKPAATKPAVKPTTKPVAPAKKKVKATPAPVRARTSKKLYREVSIEKLTKLYGADGKVLVSANAVEAKQLEVLKAEADKQLNLGL